MSRLKYIVSIILITLIFTPGLIIPSKAADTSTQATGEIITPRAIGKVTMNENVYAVVNDLIIMPATTGKMVTYTLSIHNNGNQDLNLIDYWSYLATKGGSKFTSYLKDSNIDKIPARSVKNINFYSEISSQVTVNDILIKVIKWDFNTSDFEKVLGTVSIPDKYSSVTPSGYARDVSLSNGEMEVALQDIRVGKSDKYYTPNFSVAFKNAGNNKIILSDYVFSILTSEGLVYDVSITGINGTELNPLMDKQFRATGAVPLSVKNSNWTLVMQEKLSDTKKVIPIAQFAFQTNEQSTSANSLNKYFQFADSNGIYDIKLNGVYRYPYGDKDIIEADLTLANNNDYTLPIPSIAGKFSLDGAVDRTASVELPDKMAAIGSGKEINVHMLCNIPYTFEVEKTILQIQETGTSSSDADSPLDLTKFEYTGEFMPLPTVAAGSAYLVQETGYRSSITVKETRIYEGLTSNIFAAEVLIKNNEKRQTTFNSFAGYFRNEQTDTVYPVTVTQVPTMIAPNGYGLFYAWANVPKEEQTSNLQLVMGKAINDSETNNGQNGSGNEQNGDAKQVTAYVNPIAYQMPRERRTQDNLENIDLSPYQMSIRDISTSIQYEDGILLLKMNYDLTKDLMTSTDPSQDKIILEIKDGEGALSFTKEVYLSKAKDDSSELLKIGKNQDITFTWPGQKELIYKVNTLKDFQLNIYHEIQPGQRKLLASKKVTWFQMSN